MIELHSAIVGEGKPLLVLHGFLGMGDNWKTIGNKLAGAGYEVHLLDQRNHGRSPHTEEMNYEVMAKDVVDYCNTHDLKEVILMGHSMGGKVAMYTSAENPDLVEKLIVVDISPRYYPPHHQEILEGLEMLEQKELNSRTEAEKLLSEYIEDEGTKLFLLKNLHRETKDRLSLRLNLDTLKNKVEEIGAPLPSGFRYEGPAFFIAGGRSGYITSKDENLILHHFPQAEIREIPGAGHWVHAEKMKEFYELLMDFLEEG